MTSQIPTNPYAIVEKLEKRVKELETALKSAQEHLEFCGYGDSYERECAIIEGLAESIKKALEGSDDSS